MASTTGDTSRLTALRRDLTTGVSRVVPFVTTGGVVLAIGYALGGRDPAAGVPAWYLVEIGRAGVALTVPVLGGYVAYAVADRPAFAPGFLLTYAMEEQAVVAQAGAVVGVDTAGATPGLLGALAAGLLAGHLTRLVGDLPLPATVGAASPILLVPVTATLVALPVAVVTVAVPLALLTRTVATQATAPGVAPLVGITLGAMMAYDLGGPVNKVAYVFAVGLLVEGVVEPMAAVMAAGMTPPLGAALAARVRPERYPEDLVAGAPRAVGRAMLFITEGAIPYAERSSLRIREGAVLGSAVAGGVSMGLGVGLFAPHGGLLVAPLASDPIAFLGCVALGGVVTAGAATAGQAVVNPTVSEVNSK